MGNVVVALLIAIFAISVVTSSSMFDRSSNLARLIHLGKRRKTTIPSTPAGVWDSEPEPEIVLFGAHRLGEGLIANLKHLSTNVLVVDNNPEVVNLVQNRKIACLFGDAGDTDFLETLSLRNLKMLVSTIPDVETNLLLLDFLKQHRTSAVRIFLANQEFESEKLYDNGADYVILPFFLGKKVVGEILEKKGFSRSRYARR